MCGSEAKRAAQILDWPPEPSKHRSQEDTVTTPFIFIGTHKIKPGKSEAFKAYFATFCAEIVEPQEPRLHSFYGYTAPDSDVVTIVQVHPDADSMATHMKVGVQHFAEVYAEYLEPESTLQIYGTLTADLTQTISAAAQTEGNDTSVTIREPFTGFDRLPQR
jgi:quinol monooxygenase YgiN